ncbi:MAG: putative DNA binding domain-containing protein [Candidatus Electrothrix scaldis]|nr:MAG: putative DNA binding domain-containing protein [Candidatus Electrothrix sp. GW3-3]
MECKRAGGRDGRGELPKDFWETYSAMANSDGGTVLLGISQKGSKFSLSGIERTDKVKQDLFNTANNPSKVSVNLLNNTSVRLLTIEGRSLLQVEIPRANREIRPVYLNGNPLGNTYVRMHEGDQRLSDEAVRRMMAEQTEDSRDARILKGFGLDDLCTESLRVYRQIFNNLKPGHPWNELKTLSFLQRIGAWRMDRESGQDGLTAAGLLMFGYHTTIQEAFPFYMLDYQERPATASEQRWLDRLTLDGTWSGNLYDFYRKVFLKLAEGVKVPFELDGDRRLDESPIHVALREALCNALVHADYSDSIAVLVVKSPAMFEFRNPGMMRIPVELALHGGYADCRNRLLHQMFRYVGIGDQSGSGISKIFSCWHRYHWRAPELFDSRDPCDQTMIRMRMIDLFPQELVVQLRQDFGQAYDSLSHEEQVALAIAVVEHTVTHQRFCVLSKTHPADASRLLHGLVEQGFLEQTGSSRGVVYHLAGTNIPGPEDVFDSPNLDSSSGNLDSSSGNLDSSSGNLDSSSGSLKRDTLGRIFSSTHALPFVDDLDSLESDFLGILKGKAEEPRRKKKISRAVMKAVLLELLNGHFVTISCLAALVHREPTTLRRQYLTRMVREGELEIAFPRTPNDPRQAYTAAKRVQLVDNDEQQQE